MNAAFWRHTLTQASLPSKQSNPSKSREEQFVTMLLNRTILILAIFNNIQGTYLRLEGCRPYNGEISCTFMQHDADSFDVHTMSKNPNTAI